MYRKINISQIKQNNNKKVFIESTSKKIKTQKISNQSHKNDRIQRKYGLTPKLKNTPLKIRPSFKYGIWDFLVVNMQSSGVELISFEDYRS